MQLKKALRGAWVVPAALILDRVTKVWAVTGALRARAIIPEVIGLRYAENKGAAFSMFSDTTAFLSLITAVLIAGVSLYLFLGRDIPTPSRYGLWLVVAGGLGNLYDRLVYGYVVDFLEFLFMRFAIFNIADICITCGAALAILFFLAADLRKGKKDVQAD